MQVDRCSSEIYQTIQEQEILLKSLKESKNKENDDSNEKIESLEKNLLYLTRIAKICSLENGISVSCL